MAYLELINDFYSSSPYTLFLFSYLYFSLDAIFWKTSPSLSLLSAQTSAARVTSLTPLSTATEQAGRSSWSG